MKTRMNQMLWTAFLTLVLFTGSAAANEKEAIVVSGLENTEDTELEVKSWMVNELFWVRLETGMYQEDNLEIESWMLDEAYWNAQTLVVAIEPESSLELEPWMFDRFIWDENSL